MRGIDGGRIDETDRRLYRLLQPGALQFEIEKAESCHVQNPACTECLNRLLSGVQDWGAVQTGFGCSDDLCFFKPI